MSGEGTVGYSEGTGTRIATHALDMGGTFPEHHQRFAPGAGQAKLTLGMYAVTTAPSASPFLGCLGSGRLVVSALLTDAAIGSKYRVYFFDKNKIELGMSLEYEIEENGLVAYAEAPTTWVTANSYQKGSLLKRSGNSHIYQQVEDTGVSGATEPTWPTDGTSVVDGDVEWLDCGPYPDIKVTPLIVFSNSMGASFCKIVLTSIAGGVVGFWFDGI